MLGCLCVRSGIVAVPSTREEDVFGATHFDRLLASLVYFAITNTLNKATLPRVYRRLFIQITSTLYKTAYEQYPNRSNLLPNSMLSEIVAAGTKEATEGLIHVGIPVSNIPLCTRVRSLLF